MDLSGVKLYENKAVGDAGAEAVAQGSKIAFAPGKLDFSSTHGQALLGHEISHVASQARGEVKGSGFLNDSALEARADREGMMAAHGESVSGNYGGASAPLSNASAASASGPMQAKSGKKKEPEKSKKDLEYIDNREERSTGGKIKDWFNTIIPHMFRTSKGLNDLRQTRFEKENSYSTKEAEEDAEYDAFAGYEKEDEDAIAQYVEDLKRGKKNDDDK